MSTTPKTIQIFLPGGDPQGIRVAEITTRIVQLVEVPRSLLAEFLTMSESGQVALYLLVSQGEGESAPQVYIGQTGDLRNRLIAHNRDRDWWERALVVISRTNSLTQTHALFLEWFALQQAKEAGRYALANGNMGARPHTPAPLEADCYEIFDTARTLITTLGFPVFTPIVNTSPEAPGIDLYLTSVGTSGRGLSTPEGFVVRAGSRGRRANVQSIIGTSQERFRQRLLDSGVMLAQGDSVIFPHDYLFKSPSAAAVALLGRTANGWLEWKDAEGHTLDQLRVDAEGAPE